MELRLLGFGLVTFDKVHRERKDGAKRSAFIGKFQKIGNEAVAVAGVDEMDEHGSQRVPFGKADAGFGGLRIAAVQKELADSGRDCFLRKGGFARTYNVFLSGRRLGKCSMIISAVPVRCFGLAGDPVASR